MKKLRPPDDVPARFVVRAFLAGLSMESCGWVFNMPLPLVEETVRQWAKEREP